jgi:hypothetical protein
VVTLSEDFLLLHVIDPYSARIAVTFEEKLTGSLAHSWIAGFAEEHKLDLKIQKSFLSGFHLLQISGEDPDSVREHLPWHSPCMHKGWYGSFNCIHPDTDLDYPAGMKQLIQVTFSSTLPWLEDALDTVFQSFGPVLCQHSTRKGMTDYYNVLVKYDKPYFETAIKLVLPDREEKNELSYKGLAFRCFTCGSLYHSNSTCPTRAPSAPVQAQPPRPQSLSRHQLEDVPTSYLCGKLMALLKT